MLPISPRGQDKIMDAEHWSSHWAHQLSLLKGLYYFFLFQFYLQSQIHYLTHLWGSWGLGNIKTWQWLFFKKDFIYLSETERERQRHRHRHRQREKQAPCREPNARLDPRTPGSWLEDLSQRQTLNHWATQALHGVLFKESTQARGTVVAGTWAKIKSQPTESPGTPTLAIF